MFFNFLQLSLYTVWLSFAHPDIPNFLYECGNKEEMISKTMLPVTSFHVAQGFDGDSSAVLCGKSRESPGALSSSVVRLTMYISQKAQAKGLTFCFFHREAWQFHAHLSSLLIWDKEPQKHCSETLFLWRLFSWLILGQVCPVLFLNPLHPTRLPPRPLPALSTIVLFYIFGSP